MDTLPAPIARRLRRTPHLVTTRQLERLGYPKSAAAGWAREGLLDLVAPGVYRAASYEAQPTESIDAALLTLNQFRPPTQHARVTGHANLALHRLEGFPLPVARPSLVVCRGRRVRRKAPTFEVLERTLRDGDADRLLGRPATAPEVAREALTRRGLLPRAPLPPQPLRRLPLATDRPLG